MKEWINAELEELNFTETKQGGTTTTQRDQVFNEAGQIDIQFSSNS